MKGDETRLYCQTNYNDKKKVRKRKDTGVNAYAMTHTHTHTHTSMRVTVLKMGSRCHSDEDVECAKFSPL